MPHQFRIRIKNWKLLCLSILFISFLASLGFWQLSRANQKKVLLTSFAERKTHIPLNAFQLMQTNDPRFYQVTLNGKFDNQHTLLLDNKIFQGKVGYEIYTPFKASGMKDWILVDRGFIPMGATRNQLPNITSIHDDVTITGLINAAPRYASFGKMTDNKEITWPLRIEYVQFSELSHLIGHHYYPYILILKPENADYPIEWQIVTMPPERHLGYAVQWFALALTLLILSVALNCERRKQ